MSLVSKTVAALCALAACTMTVDAGELRVTSDFPGGSAQVVQIDQAARRVSIRPAGDPQFGWPCWWYFRLDGIEPGETITLEVVADQLKRANGQALSANWALPRRAAMSIDQKLWLQTQPGVRDKNRAVWTAKIDATTAWFAWGPPFLPSDAEALTKKLDKSSPHATAFTLCRTRAGRAVPAITVTEGGDDDGTRMAVWVQARQHAWESGASWVGRGFAEWLISDDPRAVALRHRAVVYFVPIMDIDNTATGNGGKEQVPYDHNRGWFADTQWNAIKTAKQKLEALDQRQRLVAFIDLHNPGANSPKPFFFVAAPSLVSKQRYIHQERFIKACRSEFVDPWPLEKELKTTGPQYDPLWKRISANWINQNTQNYAVGITLETAWNTPHSNTTGYQMIGRRLGLGLERYLRTDPRENGPKQQ
ncbi:Zinc carboxypeptidase [Symmachiella macrocystis]|uniref:Zinc carboxypeptidase n=1 Tax=Symmachiella macrocystis TaxID=2527985 RepID=A0A5C6BTP6_9PLAN|nr:M14-type cytosolic carboxypeptidase [Symmachiella macrocystis]TWU14074.1 Zinc carboxypeptidase [Symmachiella macrocystis]